FVDDLAARRDAIALVLVGHRADRRAAHGLDDLAEGLLHVPDLVDLVVGPLPVEAPDGDAPLVHDRRGDVAVAVVVRDHLAAAREADGRAAAAAVVVLQRLAVAAAVPAVDLAHDAVARHAAAAPDLDVVAAGEVELAVVEPPRHVQMEATRAVLVVGRDAEHRRDEAAD